MRTETWVRREFLPALHGASPIDLPERVWRRVSKYDEHILMRLVQLDIRDAWLAAHYGVGVRVRNIIRSEVGLESWTDIELDDLWVCMARQAVRRSQR